MFGNEQLAISDKGRRMLTDLNKYGMEGLRDKYEPDTPLEDFRNEINLLTQIVRMQCRDFENRKFKSKTSKAVKKMAKKSRKRNKH